MIKKLAIAVAVMLTAAACGSTAPAPEDFVRIEGTALIQPDGTPLQIRGTNLGCWLNPEGYMFNFSKTNSPEAINRMLCQLVGPEFTASFWKRFKDNYITADDIRFIRECGANTIRLPFHYKLFTDEDYMGLTAAQDGFRRIDDVVEWCRAEGLWLILDMHDCPAGQTGDNIDDSYGWPWLFESPEAQEQFCSIWKSIASRYRNEPVILGYELMNEPIATYFDRDYFNPMLEPLYKRAVAAIREVDPNHIVLLGGPQWNSTFDNFTDWSFDDKIMYTCHRYGGPASVPAIQSYVDFMNKTGKPMYMGEIGHNTIEWQAEFCRAMSSVGIGYTFWPYKKVAESCFNAFTAPEGWDAIVAFSEADRGTYSAIREARPDQAAARKSLEDLLEAVKFENCTPQKAYIESLQMK